MPKMDRNLGMTEVELRSIDRPHIRSLANWREEAFKFFFHKIAIPPHPLTKSDVPFRLLSDTAVYV